MSLTVVLVPVYIQERVLVALEETLAKVPHCEKGLCMTPATRSASYYSYADASREGPPKLVCVQPSCDEHGGDPATDFEHAEAIRTANWVLRRAGRPQWYEEYSGKLSAPKQDTLAEVLANHLAAIDGLLHIHVSKFG